MFLGKSKKANINYLAKIVNIKEFSPHPKPTVERLKCATVDGFTILVGIDSKPGLYVYFPAGCKINPEFLRYNNLFRHTELNANPDKSGMFDENGRVKAIKLQGVISEGFLLPILMLHNFITTVTNKEIPIEEGTEFDAVIGGDKEFWITKKYVVHENTHSSTLSSKPKKKIKGINRVLDDQFRFHYDTIIIKKCPYVITPDSLIHISTKKSMESNYDVINSTVTCFRNTNGDTAFKSATMNAVLNAEVSALNKEYSTTTGINIE